MHPAPVGEDRKVLSRELSVFLVQFSIALNNTKAYPRSHPSLIAAVETVALRLSTILRSRPTLTLGVARTQLIVEGIPTDPRNPVLKELATRLHRHQIGAIRFAEGVGADELNDFLQAIGPEPGRETPPLCLAPGDLHTRWSHVRVEPLEFEKLQITNEPEPAEDSHASSLWLGLASVAMSDARGAEGAALPASSRPADIAHAINQRARDATYDRAIVEYLLGLSSLLGENTGAEAAALRQRLTTLLEAINPDVLRMVLEIGGDLAQRRQLVGDASRVLPVQTVLDLLSAAASASRQDVSHGLLRILTKFASHAGSPAPGFGAGSDAALRDTVRQLLTGWNLDDPNPSKHRHLLELLARPGGESAGPDDYDENAEAIRIIQMALETGTVGGAVLGAVDQVAERGELNGLLDLLAQPELPPNVAEAIWARLATPGVVQRLLENPTQDLAGIERIVSRMGLQAAEAMLDALQESDSLALRKRLLAWLERLGPEVSALAVERLPGKPWFVQRNLLYLLGAVGTWPPEFSPAQYAGHSDARVRREALRLMLRAPGLEEEGILRAIADEDQGIVLMGLTAAATRCPRPVALKVLQRLQAGWKDPELRLHAVRLLGAHPQPETRTWFVSRIVGRTRWFRRPRLEPKSPEMLAMLGAVAQAWPEDPAAATALTLAARSRDRDVRDAAALPGGAS